MKKNERMLEKEMYFKVSYQEDPSQVPLRETTKTLFLEAENKVEVRKILAEHTPYNVQYIQEIAGAHLEYEKENNPDFEIKVF